MAKDGIFNHVYCIYDILYGVLYTNDLDGKIYSDISKNKLIVSGIAKFKGKNYFFKRLLAERWLEDDDEVWGEDDQDNCRKYFLTLLDKKIFKLLIENWTYVKEWFFKHSNIPHPLEYEKKRKIMMFQQILTDVSFENKLVEVFENYYQNDIIIKNYLESNKPTIKANGIFYSEKGLLYDNYKIMNSDIKVEWKNIEKRKFTVYPRFNFGPY
jgi:hypothetical protein